jgi:hypothetical protein
VPFCGQENLVGASKSFIFRLRSPFHEWWLTIRVGTAAVLGRRNLGRDSRSGISVHHLACRIAAPRMGALRLVAAPPLQVHPYCQISEFSQPAQIISSSFSSSSLNFHIFDCENENEDDDDFGCGSAEPGPFVVHLPVPGVHRVPGPPALRRGRRDFCRTRSETQSM